MAQERTPRPATPRDGAAWVTGASSGIGHAVVLELARRGWTVIATARREEDLQSLAAQAEGGTIVAAPGDVLDREAMARIVASAETTHGPIVRAFLNAGISAGDPRGAFSADAVLTTMRVNVDGTANCMEPLLPAMIARGGQIAIIASVAGYGGLPQSNGYGPSKAALINMAEALRLAYSRRGVLVQVVNPGYVKTPLTDRNRRPMPFLVPVADAARAICDGLDTTRFEIAFPGRLVWLLKAINLLPYPLYFPLIARVAGR